MEADEIKNIRTNVSNVHMFGNDRWAFWSLGPGKVKFDYGLKTLSFGPGVDDADFFFVSFTPH